MGKSKQISPDFSLPPRGGGETEFTGVIGLTEILKLAIKVEYHSPRKSTCPIMVFESEVGEFPDPDKVILLSRATPIMYPESLGQSLCRSPRYSMGIGLVPGGCELGEVLR